MLNKEEIENWNYYQEPEQKQGIMDMVREFSDTLGQTPDPELYEQLILEEFDEWYIEPDHEDKELKELADVLYVIYGYANALGWDIDEAVRRVHENNLGRCIQPDGSIKRRDDGKVIKREDYPKVDLSGLV